MTTIVSFGRNKLRIVLVITICTLALVAINRLYVQYGAVRVCVSHEVQLPSEELKRFEGTSMTNMVRLVSVEYGAATNRYGITAQDIKSVRHYLTWNRRVVTKPYCLEILDEDRILALFDSPFEDVIVVPVYAIRE